MKTKLNKLFHAHQYEVIKSQYVQSLYEGQVVHYYLIIQRCSICGKIKTDKIRL